MRQPQHDLIDEPQQTLTRLDRRQLKSKTASIEPP
jgi:hypothetical protein